MMTASATRESVLRGLHCGADGYVTKPFQIHPFVRAVKTVLGMAVENSDSQWDYRYAH